MLCPCYIRVHAQVLVGSCPKCAADLDRLVDEAGAEAILCLQSDDCLEAMGIDIEARSCLLLLACAACQRRLPAPPATELNRRWGVGDATAPSTMRCRAYEGAVRALYGRCTGAVFIGAHWRAHLRQQQD